jgi:hypothetical protein
VYCIAPKLVNFICGARSKIKFTANNLTLSKTNLFAIFDACQPVEAFPVLFLKVASEDITSLLSAKR